VRPSPMTLPVLLLAAPFGALPAAEDLYAQPEAPDSPICRIHTDNSSVNPYAWRKAFVRGAGGILEEHAYGYCSRGRGPWAFAASNVTVEECKAKCVETSCTCMDYFCSYHESDDCECPNVPAVKPLPTAAKVACVGDSITAGYLSSCGLDYPQQLQTLLGEGYAVTNYGVGGTTLLRHADHPYWNTSNFAAATSSDAAIVVIMLGTNDAKTNNWPHLADQYPEDYSALIGVFSAMASKPHVLIMTPPPLYKDLRYNMLQTAINTDLPRLVPKVATDNHLAPPIDLFDVFQGHCPVVGGTPGHPSNATDTPCDWIGCGGVDACHPSNVGYAQVAKAVHDAIRGMGGRGRAADVVEG